MSRTQQNVTGQNTQSQKNNQKIAEIAEINVTVNGESCLLPSSIGAVQPDIPSVLTLEDVVKYFDLDSEAVAIEHNGVIITLSEQGKIAVNENDIIEIVGFIGGG